MSILLLKKRVRAPTYLPETCDEQLRTRVLSGEFRSIHVEDFGFMGKTSDEKGGALFANYVHANYVHAN